MKSVCKITKNRYFSCDIKKWLKYYAVLFFIKNTENFILFCIDIKYFYKYYLSIFIFYKMCWKPYVVLCWYKVFYKYFCQYLFYIILFCIFISIFYIYIFIFCIKILKSLCCSIFSFFNFFQYFQNIAMNK